MKIWSLLSYRAGMNTQILGLAEALVKHGLEQPDERKRLRYRQGWAGWLPAYLCRVSLAGIDVAASDPLAPPWPDLIVTAGRRHEPVCRWIRARSKGRTKLVFLGRTWAPLKHFDLVITTPQYRLPARPNILENGTALHRVTSQRLERAATRWAARLASLPRPRIAVLVGGSSGPFHFGPLAARRLARQATALAATGQGALMVTTSARTAPQAAQALRAAIPPASFFYAYAPEDEENPYFGLLALADAIVVTGDSIAMLSEAVATGKPVYIFDLGTGRKAMRGEPLASADEPNDFDLGSALYHWMMRLGPRWLGRDITLVHRRLVDAGWAAWLGEAPAALPPPSGEDRTAMDRRRAVERVYALLHAEPGPLTA